MHYTSSLTELTFFRNSCLFVDFFFLLSGFVQTHSYAFRKNLNFRNYFIARTFRIFPLHLTMLFILIIMEYGKLLASKYGLHFSSLAFTGTKAPVEIIYNLFLLQCWLPGANPLSWNYPSWTISIEYYTYLLFFPTLTVPTKLKPLLGLAAIIILTFIATVHSQSFEGLALKILYFFVGSLLYYLYKFFCNKINFSKSIFTLIELILITVLIITFSIDFTEEQYYTVFIFVLIVFIFSFENGHISQLLKNNFCHYLGKISYSIYLVHPTVIYFILGFFLILDKKMSIDLLKHRDNLIFINFGNPYLNNAVILATLIIIFLLSSLTYRYIEINGQKFGKKLMN